MMQAQLFSPKLTPPNCFAEFTESLFMLLNPSPRSFFFPTISVPTVYWILLLEILCIAVTGRAAAAGGARQVVGAQAHFSRLSDVVCHRSTAIHEWRRRFFREKKKRKKKREGSVIRALPETTPRMRRDAK